MTSIYDVVATLLEAVTQMGHMINDQSFTIAELASDNKQLLESGKKLDSSVTMLQKQNQSLTVDIEKRDQENDDLKRQVSELSVSMAALQMGNKAK